MLRLRDARTGRLHEFTDLSLARVHVCGGEVREMLVADLIRRTCTVLRGHAPVVTALDVDRLADWNIHPPTGSPEGAGAAEVTVGCTPGGACALAVAALQIETASSDPLVLRVAALEFHYAEPARLDPARVTTADAELRGWRARVSSWATAPGAPISTPYLHRLAAAFEDDLATPQALQVLRDLERDESISAGAKFETFAYADRLLGVDLARDVGR